MLQTSTLLTSLAYVVPLVLIALLLIADHRKPRWLIVLALCSLPVFYITHYGLLQALKGWPANDPVPEEFELLAYDVTEPPPGSNDLGEILLWIRTAHNTTPRVHRMRYERELHQTLTDVGQRLSAGERQFGRRDADDDEQEDQAGVEGPGLSFHHEQPLELPRKDTNLN